MNSLANYHSPDDPFYYPKKKKRAHPERDIQNSIIQILNLKGHFCWKTVNRGFQMPGSGAWIPSSLPGISDILGVQRGTGRMIAIEVKTLRGRTTPQQEAFLARIRDCGGIGIVAHSVGDVEFLVNQPASVDHPTKPPVG